MKGIFLSVALAGVLTAGSVSPAWAEDDDAGRVEVTAGFTVGVQAVRETDRSSKFTEYRDVPRGSFVEALHFDLTAGSRFVRFAAANLGRSDQSLTAAIGSEGTFRIDLGYFQTPHRFSFFGATPYVENTPGVFTLNDVIRSAAEALVPTGTGTNIAAARALVSSFLSSAGPIDLGLERKRGTFDLSLTPSAPLSVNVSASHETRSGSRPYGTPLGFSNAIEIPEPIHLATTNLDTSLEYRKRWGRFRAGVAASFFENSVQTLVWDNPYRITDSTYAQAYSAGNGTARGRLALWPSNNSVRFYIDGSVKPFASTRISAAASYGTFNQNEKLQPFTINTAIPGSDPNAANALSPPRETARARAGITSLDLTVYSRLTRSLSLTAGFRYYDFANRTVELDMPAGYARLDQVWEDIPIAVRPYSFSRSRFFGELTFNLLENTTLQAGYSFYGVRRYEGGNEGEKNRTDEGTFKVSIDSRPADWLDLRVSYLDSKREWSLDDSFSAYIPGFNFKRYFEAGRNRRSLNAQVGVSPTDKLDIQLNYAIGRDDYPRSDYGLKRDDFDMYGVDISYAASKDHSLFVFYERELYDSGQAARQSGASFSTNPLDDWTANLKDSIHTIGAGQTVVFQGGKFGLDLTASYSKAAGSSSLDSPPGGTPDLAADFDRPLDTTTWWTAQASFKWRMTKNIAAVFGYWYEQYSLEDIVRNDIAVADASAGALFLGALEPGYKYHVGSLRIVYSW